MSRAAAFFSKDFIALIVRDPARYRLATGSLAFRVMGEGEWTVRLGDLEAPVEPIFDRNADLKLWFFGDAFQRFLDATLPSPPSTRQLLLRGDLAVLARFGRLFTPAQSIQSTR